MNGLRSARCFLRVEKEAFASWVEALPVSASSDSDPYEDCTRSLVFLETIHHHHSVRKQTDWTFAIRQIVRSLTNSTIFLDRRSIWRKARLASAGFT